MEENESYPLFIDLKFEGVLVKNLEVLYNGEDDLSRVYIYEKDKDSKQIDFIFLRLINPLDDEVSWDREYAEVEIIFKANSFYDGIRHFYYHVDTPCIEERGYEFYPVLNDLIGALTSVNTYLSKLHA